MNATGRPEKKHFPKSTLRLSRFAGERIRLSLTEMLVVLAFAVTFAQAALAAGALDPEGANTTLSASGENNVNDAALTKLERKWFMHGYAGEADEDRVNRLEKFCYGEAKSGPLPSRIRSLDATAFKSGVPEEERSSPSEAQAGARSGESRIAERGSQPLDAGNASNSSDSSNSSAQSTRQVADSDYSSYPRVKKLEEQIFGKTFEGEAIQERLSRLEKKAFGASSKSDDLSERVDRLSSFAHIAENNSDDEFWNSSADYLTSLLSPGSRMSMLSNPNLAGRRPPYPNRGAGLVARVANLEMNVFGKVQSGTLTERIALMESKLSIPKVEATNDLPSRVDRIAVAVNGSGLPNGANSNGANAIEGMNTTTLPVSPWDSPNVSSLDAVDRALVERLRQLDALVRIQQGLPPSAASSPYSGLPYSGLSGSGGGTMNVPLPSDPLNLGSAPPQVNNSAKHGLLHGIGKVVTKAGGLVLDTMAGPSFAPGYGPGYGYSSGMSGMGSMGGYSGMYSGFGPFSTPGMFMTRGPYGSMF